MKIALVSFLAVSFASWAPIFGQTPEYQLYGLDFSPYLNGQSPSSGAQISASQIQARLAVVASYTKWVRTYSSLNGIGQTCQIAHQMGLKCAAGASIYGSSTDSQEVAGLISQAQAGYVDLAIVGTEALFRGNVTAQQLISYINQVKTAAPGVPVTTADTYGALLNNSSVLAAADIVLFNIYPFWEGIPTVNAVSWVNGWYQLMTEAAGSKPVVISETGWPTGGGTVGGAVASPTNASAYFLDFVSWARANNVGYFYFEGFDESWKISENPEGPYFGVWDQDGNLKPGMIKVFNGQTVPDNWSGNSIPGGPGNPTVTLTYVPAWGSSADTYGQVLHLRPADYKIACYISVGQWYVKPYAAQPLTPIFADGSWRCNPASTGDTQETAIAALVFPNGYFPPWRVSDLASLPSVTSANVSRAPAGIVGTVADSFGIGTDGVTVSLSGTQFASTLTSQGGQYSFVALATGGTYTVTPAETSFSFSPPSMTYPNLAGVQTANFTTTSELFSISGQVSTGSGVSALSGVTVSLSGTSSSSAVSDLFGNYSFSGLQPGGSYSITASHTGYAFVPSSQYIVNLRSNQTVNFTSSPVSLMAKVAIFRSGLWVIDKNGNFQWDGGPSDESIFLGQTGDIAVVGDWNGDGHAKAGIFRNGLWLLDYNGNGQWDGPSIDRAVSLGQDGDIPVVGDWSGTGFTKIGVFRNGQWILDYNGNGVWDGPGTDSAFFLGQKGDIPIVGDWNGDGRQKTGVFRAGLWVLDYNGNGVWDGSGIDRALSLGQSGDIPVVGDWSGTGFAKIGVFRSGLWVLDYNGNGVWDGPGIDRALFLGQNGDIPVVGDWNVTGFAKIGIFRNGLWVLDYNGNGVWDGAPVDKAFPLGQTGDTPSVAVW